MDTVSKIITSFTKSSNFDLKKYVNLNYSRLGQDVRYSLNDSKLKKLGWEPKMDFDNELDEIVEYYKDNFIW